MVPVNDRLEGRPAPLAARAPSPWLAACPVLLAAVAYAWIVRVGFRGDDLVHLYRIANVGPLDFVLTPFGGHALAIRNLAFLLSRHAFGLRPAAFMSTMLLTHLVNVWLCYRVSLRLTNDPFAAGTAAALWGMAPDSADTLSWYSVYGQVMATTALACLLVMLARKDAPARPTPGFLAALLALAAIGAFCFGTGLAVALVFPLVVVIVRPAVLGRRSTVLLLALAPPVIAGLYWAYMWTASRAGRLDPVSLEWQMFVTEAPAGANVW
jgi:hypothetical protein